MKIVSKKVSLLAFIAALAFAFSGCNEQAQQSNYDKQLLGTWVEDEDGTIWSFNSDGTGAQKGNRSFGNSFKYEVASNKLAMVIYQKGSYSSGVTTVVYDLAISSDGKKAVLSIGGQGGLFRKAATEEQALEMQKASADYKEQAATKFKEAAKEEAAARKAAAEAEAVRAAMEAEAASRR